LKKIKEKKWKVTAMPWLMLKWIKILMLKFLGGGATFIQGGTSIPESLEYVKEIFAILGIDFYRSPICISLSN
jgi:hypothetical protein